MNAQSTLYIPDISGFTKFVTTTEIDHSNHIISELIEIILNANVLNLEVSEIEGDAVLFYRKGDPPTINELFEQSKKMFVEFHKHLRVIDRDNVCQCGACTTASGLSLKFIAHQGEIKETAIGNFNKLYGGDVILAHRLLKNEIRLKEYLLMTNNYFNSAHKESEIGEIFPIQDGKETIENFGDINIKFISLSNLLNEIPPISLDDLEDNRRNFKLMVNIKSPIQFVHQMLTDQKQKLKWIPGIKDIKESSYINRINSSHTCVFDNLEVHFVTRRNEVKKDSMIYGENIELKSGLSFVSDFKLVSVDSGTDVYLKVTPGKPNYNLKGIKKVFWILKANIVLIVLNRSNKKSMKYFKRFVEEEFQKNKN
jgi:hypothetical protein